MTQTSSATATPALAAPPGAAQQDFEDFIYLISHDVRASVRALIELPQWIAEDIEAAGMPVTGGLATSIDLMNRHTGRLDRMLVDLLTYSRIGRMQETRRINLHSALDEVVEEVRPPAAFSLIRAFEVTEISIGERDILTLLDALVRNAVRHHDRDSGRILVTSRAVGGDVVLCVADDGPGIEEKFRDQVFDAMRTLRPRDEVEGSGMGLANVRKIAGLYGGDARISARPEGRGCLVEVRLPVAEHDSGSRLKLS